MVFTIRHPRKVNRNNTILYQGKVYQLLPLNGIKSFCGKWIEVCEHRDGRMSVFHKGKKLSYLEITEEGYLVEDNTKILNQRQYFPDRRKRKKRNWKPPENHPWRKYRQFESKNVTF